MKHTEKCLIIAAGEGSRIRALGNSKPLIPFKGQALILHIIENAWQAGLREFHVVSGYNGALLRQTLDAFADKQGVQLQHIENKQWQRGNGVSVLSAASLLAEPFFLMMSDHLFDPSIIADMNRDTSLMQTVTLAVDTDVRPKATVDIDDVTKVAGDTRGRIVSIGKQLASYNAYDTGIFLCRPMLFEALQQSIKLGDESLSGGISILAAQQQAVTFDVNGRFWIDVDDPRMFELAMEYYTPPPAPAL